jgi:dihydroorotase
VTLPPVELLIRAGRVYCPVTGIDGPGSLAISGGVVVAAGPDVDALALETREYPDGVALPGLVDFHAHPGLPESRYAISPDEHMLPTGVTTVMAQGEAGAANVERYRRDVIETSKTRVFLALNLARRGEEYGGPCLADLREANVEECAAASKDVWGISVNTSLPGCGGSDPREVMRLALDAAERAQKPLLVGTRRAPDWPLDEQLPLLRAGDIVTYCFHGMPEGLVRDGRVRHCVWAARKRGVRFDLGHGASSFSFQVAETCLREGFLPDTISTDLYRAHLGAKPPHSLPLAMSKLIAAGMSAEDVFDRVTIRPSAQLESYISGHLVPGAAEDVCVIRPCGVEGLTDLYGEIRMGTRWEAALTVCRGQIAFEWTG